jgi:hypothetical protein
VFGVGASVGVVLFAALAPTPLSAFDVIGLAPRETLITPTANVVGVGTSVLNVSVFKKDLARSACGLFFILK